MKIKIEYDKGETLSPIGFAEAVIKFWDAENVDCVADAFKEMVEHLQVHKNYIKNEDW